MEIAETPEPPYYAVVFTSRRTEGDRGYSEVAARMNELAAAQPGYLGIEAARNDLGITVSYWRSLEDIRAWKAHADHKLAQDKGYAEWYSAYRVRICLVEREYGFSRSSL